jgi:hypothetical protein
VDTETVEIRNFVKIMHKALNKQGDFKRRTHDSYASIPSNKGLKIYRIPIDAKTRRNSTYLMLDCFLKEGNHINDPEYMQIPQKSMKRVRLILLFLEQILFLALTSRREDICTLSKVTPSSMLLLDSVD